MISNVTPIVEADVQVAEELEFQIQALDTEVVHGGIGKELDRILGEKRERVR